MPGFLSQPPPPFDKSDDLFSFFQLVPPENEVSFLGEDLLSGGGGACKLTILVPTKTQGPPVYPPPPPPNWKNPSYATARLLDPLWIRHCI